MRLRNPATGTVISAGEDTGNRLVAAGWEAVDEGATSTSSTAASRTKTQGDEDQADENTDTDTKPKTRRRSSR